MVLKFNMFGQIMILKSWTSSKQKIWDKVAHKNYRPNYIPEFLDPFSYLMP
jgi:hypothetical protein